jgi:hypothetical protein
MDVDWLRFRATERNGVRGGFRMLGMRRNLQRHSFLSSGMRLFAAFFVCLGCATVARAEPPKWIVAERQVEGPPYFGVYVPHDWSLSTQAKATSKGERFVLQKRGGGYPYIWAEVREATPEQRDEELEIAKSYEHREFLDGGDDDRRYFDSEHRLIWRRERSKGNQINIYATYFGDQIISVTFFDKSDNFSAGRDTIFNIAANFEPFDVDRHGETNAIPSPEVSSRLFEPSWFSGFGKYLMWPVLIGLVALFVWERWLHRKHVKNKVSEVEEAKRERLKKEHEVSRRATRTTTHTERQQQLADAEAYFRQSMDSLREKQRKSAADD